MRSYFRLLFLVLLGTLLFSACKSEVQEKSVQQEVTTIVTLEATPTIFPGPTTTPFPTPSLTNPVPTQTPDNRITDRETVLANASALVEAFEEKLQTTGWIRWVFTSVYFDNMSKEYWDPQIKEEWYLLDPDGRQVEGYNWVTTTDGAVLQEALYQGGYYYNLTYGGSSREQNEQVDFVGSFLPKLNRARSVAQEAVEYYGVKAWKFTAETNDGGLSFVEATFFDMSNGYVIGSETYVVQSDGSLKLVSGAVDQKWEINAEPPLDRFETMRARAEKQSP